MGGPITAPWDVCVNTDFSSPSGLADADAFNTCYETWGGAVVTTLDSLIGRLPNSPPVSPAFGGVITKFNIAVSGML